MAYYGILMCSLAPCQVSEKNAPRRLSERLEAPEGRPEAETVTLEYFSAKQTENRTFQVPSNPRVGSTKVHWDHSESWVES